MAIFSKVPVLMMVGLLLALLIEQIVLELGHRGARERAQIVAVEKDLVLVCQVSAQKVLVAKLFLAQIAVGVHVEYFGRRRGSVIALLILAEIGGSGERKRVGEQSLLRTRKIILVAQTVKVAVAIVVAELFAVLFAIVVVLTVVAIAVGLAVLEVFLARMVTVFYSLALDLTFVVVV